MTTYAHMTEVSKDPNLTNSQKLHELFKDAKARRVSGNEERFEEEIELGVPGDAEEVASDGWGQILIFRYPDNTYHMTDTGAPELMSFDDDFDNEMMDEFWENILQGDDGEVPLFFYHGGFHDEEAEKKFLTSFPE